MDEEVLNFQKIKHVGYTDSTPEIKLYFSMDTVLFISKRITDLLRQIYPPGLFIPLDMIINIMNAVYDNYRPSTADIYSRYNIHSNENYNCVDEMINQCIQIIVTQVKDYLITKQTNAKLTQWTTVLGDFNKEGLRSHSPLKILEKRPQTMQFNMNY